MYLHYSACDCQSQTSYIASVLTFMDPLKLGLGGWENLSHVGGRTINLS